MPLVEIEIPAASPYVGVVRLALASLARVSGFDEERVDDLKIAVSEACANAVIANEQAGSGAPVTVTWEEEPDRVTVEVGDRGAQLDPEASADSLGIPARLVMSVALLETLVDECHFSTRDGGGTLTSLTFSR